MISVHEAMRRERQKMGQPLTLIHWNKMMDEDLLIVVYRVKQKDVPNYRRVAVYQDRACHMSVVMD